MRARCRDKKDPNYGGRGVKVAPEWEDFEVFLRDVGPRPSLEHSLDRFPDNDGDYVPGNVRWATTSQQARNRRTNVIIEYRDEKRTLVEWAEVLGLNLVMLRNRYRDGWTPERIFETPHRSVMLTFRGKTESLVYWSKKLKIDRTTILWRLRHGWPVEETLSKKPSFGSAWANGRRR